MDPLLSTNKHTLTLLVCFGLACLLGKSVSVINLSTAMGGPIALGSFLISLLALVADLVSLTSLYLILRSAPKLLGYSCLLAACVADSLILLAAMAVSFD